METNPDPRVDQVRDRLAALPPLRCPAHVVAAAEHAALGVAPARERRPRRHAFAAAALAASVVLGLAGWPREPQEPPLTVDHNTIAEITPAEAQRVLAELDQLVRGPTAEAGARALQSGIAKPASVIAGAMADSQLGRWGVRAAGLLDAARPQQPGAI